MLDWLLIVCSGIAFYMILLNSGYVVGLFQGAMDLLTPFAAGVVIAYIINPLVMWSHKHICRSHAKLHWLAMLLGYVIAFVIMSLLVYLITT